MPGGGATRVGSRRRELVAAAFGAFVLSACGGTSELRCDAPTTIDPVLGEDFFVRYEETAAIAGESLRVGFSRFDGDGRCPRGVACAWEGDAVVGVTAVREGAPAQEFTLHTHMGFQTEATYLDYRVRLLDLLPYPEAGRAIETADRCIELRVSKTP